MKKALIVGVLAAIMSAGLCQPVLAGSSTDAALGLGAFAVFNQFLFGQPVLHPAPGPQPVIVYPGQTVIYAAPPPPVVYYASPPPVVYAPPPVVYYAPPPVVYAPQPVIYPNGYVYYGGPKHHRRHRHHDEDD